MEKKTLDNSRIIIKLIKSNPSLWDPNHSKYSHRDINEKIWCELSNEAKVSICDLKAKWNTLRNSYTRSSREDNIKSNKPRAKWYLEDDMSFLKNVVQHRSKRLKYQKRLSKCQTNNVTKSKDCVNEIKNNEDDDITIINEPSIDDSNNIYNYNSQSPVHSTTTLSSINDQTEFENHNNNELITNGEDINSTLVKPLKISRTSSELHDEIGATNVNQYLQYESHHYQQQQEQPNSDSLFFQSIEMDFIKLPIKKKRTFKTNVMKLLNELLDETDEENRHFEPTY